MAALCAAWGLALIAPAGAQVASHHAAAVVSSAAPLSSGGLVAPSGLPPSPPPDGVTGPAGAGGATGPTGVTGVTGVTGAEGEPQLSTDLPCYLANRIVQLNGSGFPASTTYAVTLDQAGAGFGHVSAAGAISGTLTSPALPAGTTQATHQVMVLSPGATATTQFDVTQFGASYAPQAGNPRTLLVRYSVYGLGLGPSDPNDPTGDPAPVGVYLHYVGPRGTAIRTVQIGITSGPCGSLPLTIEHHLFGFSPVPGTWHLQFDAARRYSAGSVPRVVHVVTIR
jgi:hypothetical protein